MKTTMLLFALCTVAVYTRAQEQNQEEKPLTPDQAMFEKGITYYEEGHASSAASEFRKLMVEYPASPLVGRAHYNVGYISFQLKDYEMAKLVLNEILTKPYNERDSNDLMEPYTLYKHHTCRLLAEIALEEKDYTAAEKYIHLFDKVYPYQHFNEWAAYDMYLAVMKARMYEGKNQSRKAMEELLPHVFNNVLASNQRVLDEIIELLEKNYTAEAIREEFTQSLASLTFKKSKRRSQATIVLYGVTVPIEDYFMDMEEDGRQLSESERYREVVKENVLFKRFL